MLTCAMYWIALIALKYAACAFIISELRYSRAGVIVNAGEKDSARMEISLRCTPLRCTPRKKKRPQGDFVWTWKYRADATLVLFFRITCLNTEITSTENTYMLLSSSKERLDAGDKLAIYLTGNHHGALHVLWRVNRRFHIIAHGMHVALYSIL